MRYIYEIPPRLPVFFSYPKNSVLHPVSKKIAARFAHQHSVLYHVSKPLQKGALVEKDAKDFSNSRFFSILHPLSLDAQSAGTKKVGNRLFKRIYTTSNRTF